MIESLSASDSGYYRASFEGNDEHSSTSAHQIVVGTADRYRLVNMSTRAQVTTTSPTSILGFVIEPPAAGSYRGKEVLIRVVGPSLADLGMPQALSDPELVLHSVRSGNEVTIGFTQIVFPDGSTPISRYYERVREVSTQVGAFPITLPSPSSSEATDQVLLIQLPVGGYTVTARSKSGSSGDVLIEVYEVY